MFLIWGLLYGGAYTRIGYFRNFTVFPFYTREKPYLKQKQRIFTIEHPVFKDARLVAFVSCQAKKIVVNNVSFAY